MKNRTITKNESLEKRIIQKVYKYESKRTYKTILSAGLLFLLTFSASIFLGFTIYSILKEQGTLSLFEILSEDAEVIRENVLDVINTFMIESPQLLMTVFLSLIALFSLTCIFIVVNYKRIKNRVASIKKYFK